MIERPRRFRGGPVNSDDVRATAYAELVAGLIDARDRAAEERFDAELDAAEIAGRIDLETARILRWWQRESLRAVVNQAEMVVPPTLAALETAAHELRERTLSQPGPAASPESAHELDLRGGELPDDEPDEDDYEGEWPHPRHALSPPADLRARRLLVAGLTPLRDP